MLLDLLPAFALFALVSSITPGPNNTMLLASGVNFGFLRTIPHALGISLGFMLLVVAVGLGLGEIFHAVPWTYTTLRWTGAAYLLYLAWCIATSGGMSEASGQGRKPMTFLSAAAFQWVCEVFHPKRPALRFPQAITPRPDLKMPNASACLRC